MELRGEIDAAAASVQQRFQVMLDDGFIRPSGSSNNPGSIFALDKLAGDIGSVFFSLGPRYREMRHPQLCYGFIFEPAVLVNMGAAVGPDLLDDYEALADQIVTEIDGRLPSLEAATPAELDQFMALMGDDSMPGMREHLQATSTSRYHNIMAGLETGDKEEPGARVAAFIFRKRVAALQAVRRKRGAEALALLETATPELELVIPGALPLSSAAGLIVAGELRPW